MLTKDRVRERRTRTFRIDLRGKKAGRVMIEAKTTHIGVRHSGSKVIDLLKRL